MHRTAVTNLEDAGIYTLAQLAERTKVPKITLQVWARKGLLPVVKIDGINRTTVHAVKLAAKDAESHTGRPRSWELEPIESDEVGTHATA